MTIEEKQAIAKTVELWDSLLALPFNHADDMPDLKYHIHAIQNIVFAREGQRVFNSNSNVGEFKIDGDKLISVTNRAKKVIT